MKLKLFPSHFNLLLNESERSALDNLFHLDPSLRDEIELVHRALRTGIRALNEVAKSQREDPHFRTPTRSEIEARARSEIVHAEVPSLTSLQRRVRENLLAFLRTSPRGMSEEEAEELLRTFEPKGPTGKLERP